MSSGSKFNEALTTIGISACWVMCRGGGRLGIASTAKQYVRPSKLCRLGRVLHVANTRLLYRTLFSIPHGVQDATWRYEMRKCTVDFGSSSGQCQICYYKVALGWSKGVWLFEQLHPISWSYVEWNVVTYMVNSSAISWFKSLSYWLTMSLICFVMRFRDVAVADRCAEIFFWFAFDRFCCCPRSILQLFIMLFLLVWVDFSCDAQSRIFVSHWAFLHSTSSTVWRLNPVCT